MADARELHEAKKPRRRKGLETTQPIMVDADLANQALCALNQILEGPAPSEVVDVTIQGDSTVIRLPRGLGEILRQVLASAAAGQPLSVVPARTELTTQQAADMLNVSRPYLSKLVEEGHIEFCKVGTHRRIPASSVRAHRRQMELDSKKAADELTALTEELGLY